MNRSLCICAMLWFAPMFLTAQEDPQYTLQLYQQFLQNHQNLTSTQLKELHPAGVFEARIGTAPSQPYYLDSIDRKYTLTVYEKELLQKHGFVVTSRISKGSFLEGFADIFHADLPVFVSTDAILHAVHMSYDAILMDVERTFLIHALDSLLAALHGQLPVLAAKYAANAAMQTMLRDVDVYLTVPRRLLGQTISPFFSDNSTNVDELLRLISAEKPASVNLFASTQRTMDFSQFTVRGHYVQPSMPEFSRYFQAMMWLGRTEIYLIAPKSANAAVSDSDIQRQTIDAVLVREALEGAQASALLDTIDSTIRFFVGDPDNVTSAQMKSLLQETGIQQASELLDVQRWKSFQDTLKQKGFAYQRILSQILMSDPMSPDKVEPASAFLLLGQRFVIDSYVTGSVVYDKIPSLRMLPSTLDVLFALGNNAAVQLLGSELVRYNYGSNLAAVRYLVDSHERQFWESSLYNGWLAMIKTLNPPQSRVALPIFMQTAAWWQEKMNTQLASWAQLRHDNLLYAKQSYSAGVICSFPKSYVEPIPEFFHAVTIFADIAAARFGQMQMNSAQNYFFRMKDVASTLEIIAQKTLSKTPLSDVEQVFLSGMLIPPVEGCGMPYTGWYPGLFYRGETDCKKNDLIVADVHTAPTDEGGAPIGWVLHVGTGPLDMAILTAEAPDGQYYAFAGPVLSYYEHLTTGFKRLTDEEWKTIYNVAPSIRPNFVNLYMANTTGSSPGEALSLATDVEDGPISQQPSSFILHQNYPNPFNPATVISFSIPPSQAYSEVDISIVNVQGQIIANVFKQKLPSGNYSVKWNGASEKGISMASGVYFYQVFVGQQRQVGKMVLIK